MERKSRGRVWCAGYADLLTKSDAISRINTVEGEGRLAEMSSCAPPSTWHPTPEGDDCRLL